MSNDSFRQSTAAEFARALEQCVPADFDGHTEFRSLSAEQKLEWICQAASFIHEFKGRAAEKTSAEPTNGAEPKV